VYSLKFLDVFLRLDAAVLAGSADATSRVTPASIWLAAAIGTACGLPNWALVLPASTLGLLKLTLGEVERRLKAETK
jgi:uncharacterized membrane protein YhiD involved in acid resistance